MLIDLSEQIYCEVFNEDRYDPIGSIQLIFFR